MEVLQGNGFATTSRKGCNPILSTQRSKIQSKRASINQQLHKQMRLRNGAENLFHATSNPKVKETVALELSFVNSNLQLLKEELSDINSTVEPYQNKSGKATSIPMLPLGLKDTKELEFMDIFENILSEHYGENPRNFGEELADFADIRNSVRTPARTHQGVKLLLEYYNQLYFIENRFFSPVRELSVFFNWYDCITGVPAIERSVSLEKACVLFNVGALYSQISTRSDRSRKKEIEIAIDGFQRAAGVYNYLRSNYANAPTQDLSPSFLSALTYLMLAQAQECELERKILGGFEIELGKCVLIAQESMKVADKYKEAEILLSVDVLVNYVPFPWLNMARVKVHHYQALAHYYASLGLLEQHELAEPVEIANLLSTLYLDDDQTDVPRPDAAARRKEDRRRLEEFFRLCIYDGASSVHYDQKDRGPFTNAWFSADSTNLSLGKSHLRHAVFCHEQALQTHSLCKMSRTVDILKEYLQHAHQRSMRKFAEIDSEQDFFELIETPNIQGHTDRETSPIPPDFESVATNDMFRRLGPLTVFSIHYELGSPRDVTLANQEADVGFTLQGDSPVTMNKLDETAKQLGLRDGDVVISVDGEDVKWRNQAYVVGLIGSRRGRPVVIKVVTVLGNVGKPSATAISSGHATGQDSSTFEEGSVQNQDSNRPVIMRRHSFTKNPNKVKKRNSFAFLSTLKRRPKPNHFSTLSQHASSSSLYLSSSSNNSFTLQRTSTPAMKSQLYPSATVLRKKKAISGKVTQF